MREYDVIVIGAGQAGLAAGHALRTTGLSFTLLEAGEQPGGSWPRFYDSLTLFSRVKYCALPGLPFPGDQARYPRRDEAAAYLRRYADHFAFPVRTGSRVAAVRTARRGNSAIQIAVELAQAARVSLAIRSPLKTGRQRPLGVDLHHWLHYSGIDRLPLGRRAAASVGVLDDGRYAAALAAGRPQQRDMFTTFSTDGVRWPGGHEERIDTVILGTGYRPAAAGPGPSGSGPAARPAGRPARTPTG